MVALGHTHICVTHNHTMSDTFGMLMLLASVLLALCQLEIIHRLHTWDNSPGSNSVSGTGSHMWHHFIKRKCASEPFFPFSADQNGFIQETEKEITILKLPVEILYLYEKKREFDCQISVFSVATYLLCYSSCLKFPELLICSYDFILVRATLHRRIVSHGEYPFFFLLKNSFFKLKTIFIVLKQEFFLNIIYQHDFYFFFFQTCF